MPISLLRASTRLFLTTTLILGSYFSLAKSVLAAPTAPGTVIDNTATGSFTGETSGTTTTVTSNTVTFTVMEVAGITVTPDSIREATIAEAGINAGSYQEVDGINTGDLVYFDFVITNVGNDPTAFFIPVAPSTVTGATFSSGAAPIQIIAVDPDGSGTGYAPITDLNGSGGSVNVTTAGTTTTLLGATNGYIPAGGTVTVRVPVKVTETEIGNPINVVLGNTTAIGDQNEDYEANGNDLYTSDLADNTTNPYTNPPTVNEAAGSPPTEKEASAQGSVNLAPSYQLDGYKSVKMTTDANSDGRINEGDTSTWTIHYVNTGTGTITDLQIADALPSGVAYIANTLTVQTGNTTTFPTPLSGTQPTANISFNGTGNNNFLTSPVALAPNEIIRIEFQTIINTGGAVPRTEENQAIATGKKDGGDDITPVNTDNVDNTTVAPNNVIVPPNSEQQTQTTAIDPTQLNITTPNDSPIKQNPKLDANFCLPTADLMFVLDESGSVDGDELEQQREGVKRVLQYLIDNEITGKVAIVSFAQIAVQRLEYTDITQSNINPGGAIDTALANYGTILGEPPFGTKPTNWEAALNEAQTLQNSQSTVVPDAVFFFTDGRANRAVADDDDTDDMTSFVTQSIDEANFFKQNQIHIYGINIDPNAGTQAAPAASFNDLKNILDGEDTLEFTLKSSSNPITTDVREADYLEITNYAALANEFGALFRQICGLKDYGDAPDLTNGTATGDYRTTSAHGGPAHIVFDDLKLGSARTDADDGTLQNEAADADDTTNRDDEDGVSSFPALKTNSTTYSLEVKVVNNTGGNAYLVGWIDFNQNGIFEESEGASQTIIDGATNATLNWSGISGLGAGTTYARFRLGNSSELNTTRPNGTGTTTGIFMDGEVEDYRLSITGVTPDLLLVKRITKLTPGDGSASTSYLDPDLDFVNDGRDGNGDGTVDNFDPGWPGYDINNASNDFTLGRTDLVASPGDKVEYTIYFLNVGDTNASNVEICDALSPFLTFNPSSTIELFFAGNSTFLTSSSGDDQGEFVAANTVSGCKEKTGTDLTPLPNLNGTIKVNLTDEVTPSSEAVTPNTSSGYIRFEASVD